MSNYYAMRDAKVRISHELSNRGWKIYGYKADESDSMTDYYSPAYWDGIAEKNGFILVIDNSYAAEKQEITKYNPKGNLSLADREKINKLEQMTVERGATAGEEENAKKLIENIKSKVSSESAYEVIGYIPGHMANPGKCKWHIEKDGKIYDKGTGITKYSDMPNEWQFDINKMEYTNSCKTYTDWDYVDGVYQQVQKKRELPEETKKIVNDFKALILRFERVVNGMNTMGDGTKETEEAAKEQQIKAGYEKVITTEYKTEIKANEIEKPAELKEGMYFKLKSNFNHGSYKGIIYKINYVKENPFNGKFYIDANRLNRKLNKVLTGTAAQGNSFHCELDKLLNWVDKGDICIVELKEVQTPTEVEKWIKIDKNKNTYNSKAQKTETKQEESKATEEKPETKTELNHEITIKEDTDTRDNSIIWVVKLVNRVSYDEFCNIRDDIMSPIKGYYSKFKGGFIFKYNPTSILKPDITEQSEQTTETPKNEPQQEQKQEETTTYNETDIKDGFVYDCHFKEWNLSITELQEYCSTFNIPYYNMGNKIGFTGITAEQARQAKEISDINESIFFVDSEIAITEQETTTNNSIAESIYDYSLEILTQLNLKYNEYKALLSEKLKNQNINITDELLNCIEFEDLKKVLQDIKAESEQIQETNNIIDFEEYKNNMEENIKEVENQYNSNTLNVDDILNQFDNIEINNNSRISKDDEEFCKGHEKQYNEFIEFSNNYIQYLENNSINNLYHSSKDLIKEMNKERENNKNYFIDKIVNHFKDTYKVTLTSKPIQEKYNIEIDYNTIVSEIIEQLDGYSFKDKAEKEIKDEFKQILRYEKIQLKNKKISIENFFYAESYDYGRGKQYSVGYSSDSKFYKLFKAMSHFLYHANESYFSKLYNVITREYNDNVFKSHDIANNGILTLKLYKNGKIDLEFSSCEYARQFAKEYCGYIEKSA